MNTKLHGRRLRLHAHTALILSAVILASGAAPFGCKQRRERPETQTLNDSEEGDKSHWRTVCVRGKLVVETCDISVEVRGDYLMYGGDIIVGRADHWNEESETQLRGNVQTFDFNPWPKGRIPYHFIDKKMTEGLKDQVREGMRQWQSRVNTGEGNTIQFVELSAQDIARERYWLEVTENTDPSVGGTASTGARSPGRLSIQSGGRVIIHELGHALGLNHEHQRDDRDSYIVVNHENVEPKFKYAFDTSTWPSKPVGPFDFDSLMLYPSTGFSKNGKATMTKKSDGTTWDSPQEISSGDVAAVRGIYKISDTVERPIVERPITIVKEVPVRGAPIALESGVYRLIYDKDDREVHEIRVVSTVKDGTTVAVKLVNRSSNSEYTEEYKCQPNNTCVYENNRRIMFLKATKKFVIQVTVPPPSPWSYDVDYTFLRSL